MTYTIDWTVATNAMPPSCPRTRANPFTGVSASRFRNPVWMSRARSVPAFIVANSAPCMKGIASAKATNRFVGKPGIDVAAWRPPEFTASSASGKMIGAMTFAGWRYWRTTDRRARW